MHKKCLVYKLILNNTVTMKKFLLPLLLLTLVIPASAQVDVVESSERRTPSWVNGIEKNYIIVSGSGTTIEAAQQNALNTVKERIVSSVAENVQTRSEMSVQEVSGGNVSSFLEKFATTTTTESAKVPFLQGISISKVEAFYWEKTRNKADRSIRFNYHLKYPFSQIELQRLVDEFKRRDRELTDQLNTLLNSVDLVTSVEEIEKNIGELNILLDYFMDGRKDKASLGITRYRSLLGSIDLVELESGLGEVKYALRLGNRFISTTKKPTVRSECARITSTVSSKDFTLIKYDFDNCYEDPENNIEVAYRFGSNSVRKSFYFDITSDKAAIFVSDPIRLTARAKDDATVQASDIDLTVVAKYDAPFTITKVELEWRGNTPLIVDNVGKSFSGKGNHSLRLSSNQPLAIGATSSLGQSISMLSGYIYFRNDRTGEQKTYRIYNHTYTTNW